MIEIVDEQAHKELCAFPKSTGNKRRYSQTFLEQRISSLEQLVGQDVRSRSSTTSPSSIRHSDEDVVRRPNFKSVRLSVRSEPSPEPPPFAPSNENDTSVPGLPTWLSSSEGTVPLMLEPQNFARCEVNRSQPNKIVGFLSRMSTDPSSTSGPVSQEYLQRMLSPSLQDGGDNPAEDTVRPSLDVQDTLAGSYETLASTEQEVSVISQYCWHRWRSSTDFDPLERFPRTSLCEATLGLWSVTRR